jgi:UPF0042 nucleotide-binding protein
MQHQADVQKITYVTENPEILIVTGYSGAGKSTVLRALEDSGFFCVDNLPVQLLASFFQLVAQSRMKGQKVALGIDVRGGYDMADLAKELNSLSIKWSQKVKVFFLTSTAQTLLKRYQETRRKHPLGHDVSLSDAIMQEQDLLRPLIDMSDLILDTDQLTIHQLRNFVKSSFSSLENQSILVSLTSFGFKYGVPPESNFVYDLRSLPNPFFVTNLKQLNGTDSPVQDYLFDLPEVKEYWDRLSDFLSFSIKKSFDEGRFFMNIAIGCTGGRHRSVAFVHKLSQLTIDKAHFLVKHRDLGRDDYRVPL